MRYPQLVRRVRKILDAESPYRHTDEEIIAALGKQRGQLGIPERFRREVVLRTARQIIAKHSISSSGARPAPA